MNWVSFTSISSDFANFYELKHIEVNLFALLYIFIYPIVNFPASNIIDNKSMKFGVNINHI